MLVGVKCYEEMPARKGGSRGSCGTVAFSISVIEGLPVKVAFGREQNEGKEYIPGVQEGENIKCKDSVAGAVLCV